MPRHENISMVFVSAFFSVLHAHTTVSQEFGHISGMRGINMEPIFLSNIVGLSDRSKSLSPSSQLHFMFTFFHSGENQKYVECLH